MCFSKEQETRPREKERKKKQRKQGNGNKQLSVYDSRHGVSGLDQNINIEGLRDKLAARLKARAKSQEQDEE